MKKIFLIILLISFFINVNAEEEKRHTIQIAVLLDTSNSMDGLINQAKTQLWSIVNELATAKKDGKTPELQVALYEYGNDSLSSENGYVRRVLPLTTDLDKVSEELFALETNGGTEYCGWVIAKAIKELKWSESNKDFKAIYIAGNEEFSQMPGSNRKIYYSNNRNANANMPQQQQQQQQQQQVLLPNKKVDNVTKPSQDIDYRISCKNAIKKGITVNTIHCGDYQVGVDGKWRNGAILADGIYMNIDQNRKTIDIKAPQDKSILEWNQKLNTTYVPYGTKGKEGKSRQKKQDSLAKNSSYSGNIQRVISKSSKHYRNTSWDLLDAYNEKKIDLSEVKKEDLPEEMQKMTVKERAEYLEKLLKQRQEIQEKIKKLTDSRKKYVAENQKKKAGEDTLESAISKSLRKQLQEKNYSFDEK